jgi:hypothetical protein
VKAAELTSVFRLMLPSGFVEVGECVLWPRHDPPSIDEVCVTFQQAGGSR